MRFSLYPSNQSSWEDIVDLTAHAEQAGLSGVWMADHFMPMADAPSADAPIAECWTTLAALAASVPRVRVGTLVTCASYRHPAVVAKMAATVDHISGGRMVLGLGAGWQRNEFDAYGLPFGSVRDRLARLAEAAEITSSLLSRDRTTFVGGHYQVRDAPLYPKPGNGVPILIGGDGEQGTLRIAARFADEWNTWGTPDTLARKGAVLDQHCQQLGRDPRTIRRSALALLYLGDNLTDLKQAAAAGPALPAIIGTPADIRRKVEEYAAAGVEELVIPDFTFGSLDRAKRILDRLMSEVADGLVEAQP